MSKEQAALALGDAEALLGERPEDPKAMLLRACALLLAVLEPPSAEPAADAVGGHSTAGRAQRAGEVREQLGAALAAAKAQAAAGSRGGVAVLQAVEEAAAEIEGTLQAAEL